MHTDSLRHLRDVVRRKCPEKWRTNIWFLFHDSATAHWLVVAKDFVAKNKVTLEHPPYSPDLDPAEFYLSRCLKSTLKWPLLWCYWHHEECDARAEKSFMKWLPGMFPAPLQSLTEVYNCSRGLFWRKCGLKECTHLYFSRSDSRNVLKLPHMEIYKQSSLLSKIHKSLFLIINQFSSHQNLQVWCV